MAPINYRLSHRVTVSILLLFLFLFAVSLPPASVGESHTLNDQVLELMRLGEYEKALEQLQKASSLFPYDESIRKNLAAAHAAVGGRQLERKSFDEAAENFYNARRLVPDNQEYGILRGIALYSGKRYDEAAIELEQARQNSGDNVPLLFYLGRVYYDTGDLARALDMWDKALALEPGSKAVSEMAAKARRESAVESRMEKGYSSMFVISYDEGTKPDLADAVLDVLETAYNRVGSDLSHYPVTRIPVILYTRKDFRSVTEGPAWSGGLYDGKVRLPVGGASEITPVLRGVLFHEYTHVVVGELTKGNCPVWLNEGLAEVEGRKEYDSPTAKLDEAAKTGRFLSFTAMEKSLSSLNTSDAALAYQQSYSMVSFMIGAYGLHKVREILINLAGGMGIGTAVATALADYGLDYAGVVHEWQAYVRKKHGGN